MKTRMLQNKDISYMYNWKRKLHYHLRQPAPPVVLGFNHDAGSGIYHALTSMILAKLDSPRMNYRHLTINTVGISV